MCGNEEDLHTWETGTVYCVPCLRCPHEEDVRDGTCPPCLRDAYSVLRLDTGPAIVDLPTYLAAGRAHFNDPYDLSCWNHDEYERLYEVVVDFDTPDDGPETVPTEPVHLRPRTR